MFLPEMSDDLTIKGTFAAQDGSPIVNAAVHKVFIGAPPRNCGTSFDLEKCVFARTNHNGEFEIELYDLNEKFTEQHYRAEAWKRGGFFIIAIKDARTIGCTVASGEECAKGPIQLTALPGFDIEGKVVDENDQAIAGAKVEVNTYCTYVGCGPRPKEVINFSLYRSTEDDQEPRERLTELTTYTNAEGIFHIPNVPSIPVGIDLKISHPGFVVLEPNFRSQHGRALLRMQPEAIIQTEVTLISGEPAAGFQLALEGWPDEWNHCTHRRETTDEMGRCQFSGLSAGSYTIRFYGAPDKTWALPAIVVPNLQKGEGREIKTTAVPGTILWGHVFESESKSPVQHVGVWFDSEAYPRTGSSIQSAYTDEKGRFEFDYAIAPGPLNIRFLFEHCGKYIRKNYKIEVGKGPRQEVNFYLPIKGD
jgi:hypothetical protein